jgi:hypothetical protein
MAPWELHEIFPSLDIKNFLGYPNHFSLDWGGNCPKFDGSPSLVVTHVVKFLKYVSNIDMMHQDVIIRLFFLSLETRQKNWAKCTLNPKRKSSLTIFIE